VSCVRIVQGSLILHDETKAFIFIIKRKVLSCTVYSCFFVLSTFSLWNRVNKVYWWRGEQITMVQITLLEILKMTKLTVITD
jgi:hypothetical protein